MTQIKNKSKSYFKIAGNILFYGLLLFFIFNVNAKSWVLQQLVAVGLFKADIKKEGVQKSTGAVNTNFSFIDINGKVTSTANLKGKIIFINFWASWCPPCRAEMPSIDELYKKLKNDNRYVFIFINEDEDKTKAIKFIEDNHFTIPLHSSTGVVPNEIYSGSLPTTIVIDKSGKIVLNHERMAGYNTNEFTKQLQALTKN